MRNLIFYSILFTSLISQASTRAHFMGLQAMIQIFTQDPSGGSSPDAENLFNAMNVPTQGSVMGAGKTIKTEDKVLNFVCAQGPKGRQCTILLKASSSVKMNPSDQVIEYHVAGAQAETLRSQFFLDPQGEFHLISSDGYFRIDVEAQNFTILYNGQGL